MNDDAFERFRRENPVPGPLQPPPIEPLLARLGPRPPRRSRTGGRRGWVPVAFGAAIAVGVAVLAIVLVGHRSGGTEVIGHHPVSHPRPPSQAELNYINAAMSATTRRDPACAFRPRFLGAGPPRFSDGAPSQTMLSAFGVLRRPATAADTPRWLRQNGGPLLDGTTVYTRFVRRVAVFRGMTFYLIPARVTSLPVAIPNRCYGEQRAALQRALPSIPPGRRAGVQRAQSRLLAQQRASERSLPRAPYDGLTVLSGGGGGGIRTLASLRTTGGLEGSFGSTMYGLVPDGVATVTLEWTATAREKAVIRNTPTAHNFFALSAESGHIPNTILWRSTSGAVIARFADVGR